MRFTSSEEKQRMESAAAAEQEPIKDGLRAYPNLSKFLRDAGNDRADKVLKPRRKGGKVA